jgi:hypothetical protein
MTENPYARWLRVDNDLCLPVIDTAGLDAVFRQVQVRLYKTLGQGPKPSAYLDLEPILKHFNRYLLHYFCTRETAGPKRLSRAWEGIVPTVLHFWSNVVATALTRSATVLYEEDMALMAHRLTADQLDFIVMHELGHVALDHPRRLQAEGKPGRDVTTIRHEFEFAADALALGLMRSKLVKEVRDKTVRPKAADAEITPVDEITASLHDYQRGLGVHIYCSSTWISFSAPGSYCVTAWAGRLTSGRKWTHIREHALDSRGWNS